MLPSLWLSQQSVLPWRLTRAAACGVAIGVVAAAFKLWSPGHGPISSAGAVREFVGAGLGFALLCVATSLLRNYLVRRLVPPRGG